MPDRPADGHKGTFGTVCVVGGQAAEPRVMLGGPAFAAVGALRVGAGLAVLAAPSPLLAPMLVAAPSATGLALPVDDDGALRASDVAALLDRHLASFRCLAIGPGFGAELPQQQIVARLAAAGDRPMVIDADALNALAALRDFHRDLRADAVLTPHPGEFQRLARALDLDVDPVDPAARPAAAQELARRLGCVVVLKGAATVVTDGLSIHVNATGNAALATAGTGDVLTGVIAGLVAQFHRPHLGAGRRAVTPEQQGGLGLLDCAALGVHLHGLAADLWARRHGHAGLLASDLLDLLPDAVQAYRVSPGAATLESGG
ncbi:MAG: NAD(P)H-hydrate dehydratase [Planctomycetota bacterium]